MTGITQEEADLVDAARAAMRHAHAPYSRFAVGAALRLTDGTVITGSNFENASYGLSLCAETVAIATASAQGRLTEIAQIAVAGGPADKPGHSDPITPCGRCRQVIKEAQDMAGRPVTILCAAPAGPQVSRHELDDLLPHAFGPADLGLGG
jgi:cytidine deaminase